MLLQSTSSPARIHTERHERQWFHSSSTSADRREELGIGIIHDNPALFAQGTSFNMYQGCQGYPHMATFLGSIARPLGPWVPFCHLVLGIPAPFAGLALHRSISLAKYSSQTKACWQVSTNCAFCLHQSTLKPSVNNRFMSTSPFVPGVVPNPYFSCAALYVTAQGADCDEF